MKICFLASGSGGNLKFLYLARELKVIEDIAISVIADRECDSIRFASENSIDHKVIEYSRDSNKNLSYELERINPDIIITNWHKILDEEIVDKFEGKLINLHYSLLPSFGGLIGTAPIEKAYERGCQYVGATSHYVDKGVDTGKIIAQAIVKTDIALEEAVQNVFKKGCLILLNSILITSGKGLVARKEQYDFSPSLLFSDEILDEKFWERLKSI